MNKYLIITGLAISILSGQSENIPFDWSGQYGAVSNNGRIMWNQDWSVGALFFDGTLANYPLRFGENYQHSFALQNTGDFYRSLYNLPDTSKITSRINYYRGDYSYDQLEFDVNFAEQKSIINFNGFKRSYGGPYDQYSGGSQNPLQQSYRIDYLSSGNDETIELSIGHFITESRLSQGYLTDFNHDEKVTIAGIGYTKEFDKFKYRSYGALFQQYYHFKIDTTITKAYLNRIHIDQSIDLPINNLPLLFGLTFDKQDLAVRDGLNTKRWWSTIFTGLDKNTYGLKVGTTVTDNEIAPYLNIFVNSPNKKSLQWKSYLRYEAVPEHIFSWDRDYWTLFEKWITAHIDVGYQWKNLPIVFGIDFNNFKYTDWIDKNGFLCGSPPVILNSFLSSSVSTQIPLFRDWNIDVSYRHIFEHNLYSDGIGDRLKISLNITESLFKSNMLAGFKFWGDGYLNHHPNLGYDGFHKGPYTTYNPALVLPDYWAFHFQFSAKVSNLTFNWTVHNILQTVESITTNQIFPNLNENYLLIANSYNFPPMSRLITFNFIWDFDR